MMQPSLWLYHMKIHKTKWSWTPQVMGIVVITWTWLKKASTEKPEEPWCAGKKESSGNQKMSLRDQHKDKCVNSKPAAVQCHGPVEILVKHTLVCTHADTHTHTHTPTHMSWSPPLVLPSPLSLIGSRFSTLPPPTLFSPSSPTLMSEGDQNPRMEKSWWSSRAGQERSRRESVKWMKPND